jgi:hypothetical protein
MVSGRLASIAPPHTYTNSSTNITGWIVENTSRSGLRMYVIRLRLVSVHQSEVAMRMRPVA